jgi:hypothetical protein
MTQLLRPARATRAKRARPAASAAVAVERANTSAGRIEALRDVSLHAAVWLRSWRRRRGGVHSRMSPMTAPFVTTLRAPLARVERRGRPLAVQAPPWIPVPPAGYGGLEAVVALLCEELVARGHELPLFAAPDSRSAARVRALLEGTHADQIGASLYEADRHDRAAALPRKRRLALRRCDRRRRLRGGLRTYDPRDAATDGALRSPRPISAARGEKPDALARRAAGASRQRAGRVGALIAVRPDIPDVGALAGGDSATSDPIRV